jgi:cytosine deaminase
MPSDHRDCFVIMPYGDRHDGQRFSDRYEHIIKRAVEGFRASGQRPFKCTRADEVHRSGSIQRDFAERLRTADVVIADLSGNNANVLYELGIRHALKSGTILIAERGSAPPFNISQERVIFFDDSGRRAAIRAIRAALAAGQDFSQPDSPVLINRVQREPQIPRWWRSRDGGMHPPNGLWLEVLLRLDQGLPTLHFSFFRIRYDDSAHLHPFVMEGHSFRGNGQEHSSWNTKYFRIKTADENEITIEYIYVARFAAGQKRAGYGVTTFEVGSSRTMTSGGGYYFAAEETPPYRCSYKIRRVDRALLQRLRRTSLRLEARELRSVVPALKRLVDSGRLAFDMSDALPLSVTPAPSTSPTPKARDAFLDAAIDEALAGFKAGGIPIGSVLALDGRIIGRGHNKRVQDGSPILHAEMDCLNRAGRLTAAEYRRAVMYTTLSPCAMCTGAILLYGIPTVVIGENRTFRGPEELLAGNGVQLHLVNDPQCFDMMQNFIRDHPGLWNEDIGKPIARKKRKSKGPEGPYRRRRTATSAIK